MRNIFDFISSLNGKTLFFYFIFAQNVNMEIKNTNKTLLRFNIRKRNEIQLNRITLDEINVNLLLGWSKVNII